MKTKNKSILFTAFLFASAHILVSQTSSNEARVTPASSVQTTSEKSTKKSSEDEEGIYRHTRFGIRISPTFNSFNVISKTMTNDGWKTKFGAGLLMETQLTKNVVFQTGVGVDVFGGKITYSNDPSGLPNSFTNRYLYDSPEEAIVKYQVADRNKTGYIEYMLLERNYKITYITVPLNLRMKTNKIGNYKYFGQIGADLQFRWSAYANDRAQQLKDDITTTEIELAPAQDLSKVKINDDVSFMNIAINTGLGIERQVGGVDLFLALNYRFGVFSPVDKETEYTKKVYQTSPGNLDASKLKQEYRTRVFAITLGFMF